MATKKPTKKVKEMLRFHRWWERQEKKDPMIRHANYAAMLEAWMASARAKR